jgi:hypothetical protein
MSKRKGTLQKFVDNKFKGMWWEASNEMVQLFCQKYHIAGSAGYDFYTGVRKVWEKELKDEAERVKIMEREDREWLKEQR